MKKHIFILLAPIFIIVNIVSSFAYNEYPFYRPVVLNTCYPRYFFDCPGDDGSFYFRIFNPNMNKR